MCDDPNQKCNCPKMLQSELCDDPAKAHKQSHSTQPHIDPVRPAQRLDWSGSLLPFRELVRGNQHAWREAFRRSLKERGQHHVVTAGLPLVPRHGSQADTYCHKHVNLQTISTMCMPRLW